MFEVLSAVTDFLLIDFNYCNNDEKRFRNAKMSTSKNKPGCIPREYIRQQLNISTDPLT